MGRYLLLMMPLLLGGCGVPIAVTIGSYAADGVSYVATGKSVTDHGLTAFTGRDCALLRPLLKREAICHDEPMPRENGAPAPVQVGENATVNPDTARIAMAAPPPHPQAHRYLVMGSFAERSHAERMASTIPVKVTVVDARVHGRQVHRVVAGPLSDREVAQLRDRLHDRSRQIAWEIGPVMVASAR
ncbi:MAG TPA: SPOR domain-containing protein [Stellaceae bacterium]|nr:SPOR domain-containing protein [Stellaceae bacterium]